MVCIAENTFQYIIVGILTLAVLSSVIYFGFVQQSFINPDEQIKIISVNIDNPILEPNPSNLDLTYLMIPHPDIRDEGNYLLYFYVDNNFVYSTWDYYSGKLIQKEISLPLENIGSGTHKLTTKVLLFDLSEDDCSINYEFSDKCSIEEKMKACRLCRSHIDLYKRLPCEIRNAYYPTVNLNQVGDYAGFRCLNLQNLQENFPQIDVAEKINYWKKYELNDTFYIKSIPQELVEEVILEETIVEVVNEDYQEEVIEPEKIEIVEEEIEEKETFKYTDYLYYVGIVILIILIIYFGSKLLKRGKK